MFCGLCQLKELFFLWRIMNTGEDMLDKTRKTKILPNDEYAKSVSFRQ